MMKHTIHSHNPVTIQGLIIPIEWDDDGNVVSISISTFDEDEYIIENKGKGKDLIIFLRNRIEAKGVVRDEAGRKIMMVEEYILKSP